MIKFLPLSGFSSPLKNLVLILLETITKVSFTSVMPASLRHFLISAPSSSFTWGICPSPTPSLGEKNDYKRNQIIKVSFTCT